jgi:hypothetical protein
MEAVESKRIGKYLIKVVQDEQPDSPDEWGNEDAFIVYDHRQFSVTRKGFDPREIFEHIERTKKYFYDGYHVFPLYAYIHSGVALSVGDHNFPDARWDVSMTGWVLVQKTKGWTWRRAKALEVAKAITEEWNQYLSGDVYGYKVYDMGDAEADEEDEDEGTMVDSCWGYYGEPEYCMTEAVSLTETLIEQDKHGQLELELKE